MKVKKLRKRFIFVKLLSPIWLYKIQESAYYVRVDFLVFCEQSCTNVVEDGFSIFALQVLVVPQIPTIKVTL